MFLRILLLIPLLVGCEYFEPATPSQCEALYDHLITLNYQNDPKSDPLANDLMRSLSSTGINLILSATGEKEKIVRRCTTILTQKEALNCVEEKNKDDWDKHCKFSLE
ncbi:MAG: hypothetical protein WCK96_12565 [Methylococcales bacterium]